MKQRETRKFLEDIQNAHRLLSEFTAWKTFEDYAADRLLQSAVERQLEIIVEASFGGVLEVHLPQLRAEIDGLLEKAE